MDYNEILNIAPYSLPQTTKEILFNKRLLELTMLHQANCQAYRQMLTCIDCNPETLESYYQLPFLPVRLFKELDLCSVAPENIFKTMTSSGTTGQKVSKIYLDRQTANNQQKTLVKIVSSFTGQNRMPMLIIDCPSVVKNRQMFSARGAGILGFSIFASDRCYALTDEMQLDLAGVTDFLAKHQGQKILLFGFTFMVWQHFYQELLKLQQAQNITIDLSNALLIHGGGWKKLISQAVTNETFAKSLQEVCGLPEVHDYYGMVEQTGSIYMQCAYGHLHASVFSDVIIRNPLDFSIAPLGQEGIIQVVSLLPESYPGHSLLTEDQGILLGEDDCPCGRLGKYFKVTGRLQNAELRGCSDTYAADLR